MHLQIPAAVILIALPMLRVPECAAGADRPVDAEARPIDIRPVADGWGNAGLRDVQAVLNSAAAQLMPHFPDRKLEPIVVLPRGGPIVLYERGANNEYTVRLNTGDRYWAQYSFQFAHELAHILCRYDTDPHGQDWFEESLCELASLYVLRRMGESWKTDPPYAHWRDYAKHLTEYADDRIQVSRLEENRTLAQWYAIHEGELRETATNRERNLVVATALLPLFEEQPQRWEAIAWLNAATPAASQSFAAYLHDWHTHAPEKHRPFIARIAAEFGISLKGLGGDGM